MVRLVWTPETYDVGVERGVLYPYDAYGEVWNGLVSVQEPSSDGSAIVTYIDGARRQNRIRIGDFSTEIEAYSFPDWILGRKPFGLSYRSGSKIHLVYNARARLQERTYEQKETTPFKLAVSAKPVVIPEARPSAHLIVDISVAQSEIVHWLEELLYGTDEFVAQLPTPKEIVDVFEENAVVKVVDHGDGSFTVTGPDDVVQIDGDEFTISWPSAVYLDRESYRIQSR